MIKLDEMNVLNQTLEYYHENYLFMNIFIISILIPITLCLLCILNLNIFLLILGESYIISLDDECKKKNSSTEEYNIFDQ